MVESALYHVRLLEKFDFEDIVISIKSSNVSEMIEAYRLIAEKCDYPLHLGVTEAGTERMGSIKSAVGLGSLLVDGIGDTDPRIPDGRSGAGDLCGTGYFKEYWLFQRGGAGFLPTCGRTKVDLISLANRWKIA